MSRRRFCNNKKKQLFTKRFFPAGSYSWTIPPGCTEVDVFLVGAGSGGSLGGGGGGYTKTYKKDTTGWRDGSAISVNPDQLITIIVGKGGTPGGTTSALSAADGGYSQFMNTSYRAEGGNAPVSSYYARGGNGGSGGSGYIANGSNPGGQDGTPGQNGQGGYYAGTGQGHTTREFGESTGKLYSTGGHGGHNLDINTSTTNLGKTGVNPGDAGSAGADGGYAGSGSNGLRGGSGADGLVLLRYYAYPE